MFKFFKKIFSALSLSNGGKPVILEYQDLILLFDLRVKSSYERQERDKSGMEVVKKGEPAMGLETERKFLVMDDSWRSQAEGTRYRQGYLNSDKERIVRVRTIKDKGFLAVKGMTKEGTRTEYEYQVPISDAETLLDEICEKPLIEKDRYRITIGGVIWEVDEFFGENKGLIVAEVELDNKAQVLDKPAWIGAEVTEDPRYYNSNLIKHPYSKWSRGSQGGGK